MSGKRYSEEFKVAAVRQVTDHNYSVVEVAERLGVTTKSVDAWMKRYSPTTAHQQTARRQDEEIRQLKTERRQVIEERDILKRPPRTLPRGSRKVCVHQGSHP